MRTSTTYVELSLTYLVKATSETIAARTYPLVAEVDIVVRNGMPQDSPAIMYRDWLLTDDGQRVVAQSGYVPLP